MTDRRFRPALLAIASTLALAACATPTPYAPATGQGYSRTGYLDEQIEANRFRVSFSGNSVTARETVERYLLFRAAQLTLERGFDHFTLVDRDTERRTRTQIIDNGFGPGWGGGFGGFGGWGPRWRYFRPGLGWGGWGGWGGGFGGGFGGGMADIRQIDRYEAMAEILTGRGPKPADNVRAFDARQVIENLGPNVALPEPGRR
ncbi:CC0125/CC1285 family lipoprotein [Sphingomonas qomolangmaensis]|uniref:DUF4136 domain-containing protein n=1 Tax=Sphingomonas qomolangmaensis TaxID=2918765 RepID=A0ABY5L9H2_9SPHN|nr:hypothetical protein [Sphingomonas qomolangmaensis]UUL83605.1 hypothetical protein NMP03_05135 [Sphingomonas qomolangmaensis]